MGSIDYDAPCTKAAPALPWVETPLKESAALSRAAGCRIFLKLENLQPSGSFKSRGVGNYMLRQTASKLHASPHARVHYYCSSGGNAGLACTYASQALGYPATIVCPHATKPAMIAKIRAAGAHEVIQVGDSWRDADIYVRETLLANDPDGIYCPPFDHPDIWEGNKGVMTEIGRQMSATGGEGRPDAIVASVGGGGLLNGMMQGIYELGWSDIPILAMETIGADSLNSSIKAGEHLTLPAITSKATCLGCSRVSSKTWENVLANENIISMALPDAEAAMGCWRLADDERILVEMACGVNVALCYEGKLEKALGRKLTPESKVVIVICGGSDISLEFLQELREEYGWIENKIANGPEVPSKITAPAKKKPVNNFVPLLSV